MSDDFFDSDFEDEPENEETAEELDEELDEAEEEIIGEEFAGTEDSFEDEEDDEVIEYEPVARSEAFFGALDEEEVPYDESEDESEDEFEEDDDDEEFIEDEEEFIEDDEDEVPYDESEDEIPEEDIIEDVEEASGNVVFAEENIPEEEPITYAFEAESQEEIPEAESDEEVLAEELDNESEEDSKIPDEDESEDADLLNEAPAFAPYIRRDWSDIAETEHEDIYTLRTEERTFTERTIVTTETRTVTTTERTQEGTSIASAEEAQPASPVFEQTTTNTFEETVAQTTYADTQPAFEQQIVHEEIPTAEESQPVEAEEQIAEVEDEENEGKHEEKEHSVSSDLIRGHINTIILRSLYDGDKYGLEIISEIERKSHNQYTLKQPSLYSALKRLEKDGYITSYWGDSVSGGRRKYFSLTDEGKEISERNQNEWEYSRTVIDSLISDKDYDFSNPAPTAVDMRVLRRTTSRVPGRSIEEENDYELPYDGEQYESTETVTTETVVTERISQTSESFALERAAFEEERSRMEESLRQREEMLRIREEAGSRREQELLEREFALQAEEERQEQEAERLRVAEEERREQEAEFFRIAEAERRSQEAEQLRISEEEAETIRQEAEEETRAQLLEEQQRLIAEAEENARLEERERIYAELEELHETQRREAEERAKLEEEDRLRAEEKERAEEETRRIQEEKERAEEESRRIQAENEIARLRAEAEERERKIAEQNNEIERAKAIALNADKTSQNERIVRMEPFAEERAHYEEQLRAQAEEFERMHARELAETEKRVRAEDEERFRQRESQMIHQNYINLIRGANSETTPETYNSYYYGEKESIEPYIYAAKPEKEREYRSAIQRLFYSTIREEAPAESVYEEPVQSNPAPTYASPTHTEPQRTDRNTAKPAPAEKEEPKTRALDGLDFYDLETRAEQDGIRICLAGNARKTNETDKQGELLVHKGKALFFSALLVFLICLAEGSLALGLMKRFHLTIAYPILFWGVGFALLLVTGLLVVNHYGERALRQTGNILINVIVTFALLVIVTLIIALARQIDFTDASKLMSSIIIPIIFFLNIVIFGVAYYLQIRPKNND